MIGYIYVTKNLVNGKSYIGKHEATQFEPDRYIGSGLLLKRAIDCYGIENFTQEILESCDTKEQLNLREKYWIDYYDAVNSDQFYNIASGGQGGNTLAGFTEDERIEFSKKISERWASYNEEEYDLISKKISASNSGKPKSEEHKKNISKSRIERQVAKGKNNPMYGKDRSGEKASCYGKHWYNNGDVQRYFTEEEYINIYKDQGFIPGQISTEEHHNRIKGYTNISKNGIRKKVHKDNLEEFLLDGWKLGWTSK